MEALEHMQKQMTAYLQRIELKFQEQLKEERIKAEKREQNLLLELKQMKILLQGYEVRHPAPSVDNRASYASVVSSSGPIEAVQAPPTPRSSLASHLKSVSPNSSASRPQDDTPSLTLDVSQMRDLDPTDLILFRERLVNAWKGQPGIGELPVAGLQRAGKDKNKVKILFCAEDHRNRVRNQSGWVEKFFPGARINRDAWFPVKVDRVNKLSTTDETRVNLREDIAELIGKENGIKINKVRWLSKPRNEAAYGSVVLYLDSKKDADQVVGQRTINIRGEAAWTKEFEQRLIPIRCFHCQKYGHQRYRCPDDAPTCSRCASKGHSHLTCGTLEPRCISCGEPHEAPDKGCRIYCNALANLRSLHG